MKPLTIAELKTMLPPVRTKAGRDGLSKGYAHINTLDVVKVLYEAGFQAVQADSVKPRNAKRARFAKHLIRFQHRDDDLQIGTVPQLLIYNSHDGEAAFRGLAGAFRFVCSNGLITGDVLEAVRFTHRGEVDAASVAAAMLDMVEPIIDRMIRFHEAQAPKDARMELATRMTQELFDDVQEEDVEDVAFQLIRPRRYEDLEPNAWTALNVIQENLIRGGVEFGTANGRRRVTRAVRGVERDVSWNQKLWTAAEEIFLGTAKTLDPTETGDDR